MHSDILPKSVADYYGNTRKDSKLGRSVVYSLKDHPDEQALTDYVNSGIETKFKEQGYDGIIDTGGKKGGNIHQVCDPVPLGANQVRGQ